MFGINRERKLVFPAAKSFLDLFEDAKLYDGQTSRVFLDLPETMREPRERARRFKLTSYCMVDGGDGHKSLDVTPKQVVIDFVRDNALHVGNDSMYFEIVVRSDGEALVIAQHGQIIGSHWLALIDAETIPNLVKNA